MRIATLVAFIVSLVIQVGFPLGVTLAYRRRTRAPWQAFVYGAIIFAVFQLFTWLPLSVYLDVAVGDRLTDNWAFLWLWASALATSLVEESGRWLGFRFLFPRGQLRLNWRNGVMYGLGHGMLETVLLIAGLTFIYMLAYIALGHLGVSGELAAEASTSGLMQELLAILNTSWTQPLIVAWERVLALPHQVAWSLLVMESLACRQKRWFFIAVLYHTSVALIVPGLVRLFGSSVAELVNLGFAVFSLWIILKLRALTPD